MFAKTEKFTARETRLVNEQNWKHEVGRWCSDVKVFFVRWKALYEGIWEWLNIPHYAWQNFLLRREQKKKVLNSSFAVRFTCSHTTSKILIKSLCRLCTVCSSALKRLTQKPGEKLHRRSALAVKLIKILFYTIFISILWFRSFFAAPTRECRDGYETVHMENGT